MEWNPAKPHDIIEVFAYPHYECHQKEGERFVVLDVFNGDGTALIMDKDGHIYDLAYPEQYKVVESANSLVNWWRQKNIKGE